MHNAIFGRNKENKKHDILEFQELRKKLNEVMNKKRNGQANNESIVRNK